MIEDLKNKVMKWVYPPKYCSDCVFCQHVRKLETKPPELRFNYIYCSLLKSEPPQINFTLSLLSGILISKCYHFELKTE